MNDLQQSLESRKLPNVFHLRISKEGDELKISQKQVKTVADKTEETENTQQCENQAVHNRTGTIVVKDINQSYQFATALSNYDLKGTSGALQSEGSNEPNWLFESSSTVRGKQSSKFSISEPLVYDKMHCASCKKFTRTEVRYQSAHETLWTKILSLCFHHPQDCMAHYCCVTCKDPLLKVKYVARQPHC